MSTHALFSPSAAHRWIECPGSFVYPGNTADSESSAYADDGTASHTFAALALESGQDAAYFVGVTTTVNGKTYTMDEERASFIQVYLDLVRQHALGKLLLVEHWVDLSSWLGEGQGGTADAGVLDTQCVTATDLKYGMGEKVDASYLDADGIRRPNQQLGLYALGLLVDAALLGYSPKKARLIVCQPRLGHIDEFECDVKDLAQLGARAQGAAEVAGRALVGTVAQALPFMNPGEKTCRWCRAKAECPKLAAYVAEQVRADFETIAATPPVEPDVTDTKALGKALIAVPLIKNWCAAVEQAAAMAVAAGTEVVGSDGLPMKFVEGKLGNRSWGDPAAAEAALVGQLADRAYKPRAIITAPEAGKLLDKTKTKQLWTDIFVPLIHRSPGKPLLALGSDTRPPYTGSACASDFEE